jgi:hypothetical protein
MADDPVTVAMYGSLDKVHRVLQGWDEVVSRA